MTSGEGTGAKESPLLLVIEDDEDTRLILREVFQHAGCEVALAADGEHGLAIARSERGPDLVVLDLMLPKTGGLHVLERLRAEPLTRRTPVLVFTARGDGPEAERARQQFRVTVLGKPAKPREVLETAQRLLAEVTRVADDFPTRFLVERYLERLPTRLEELEERCRGWRPGSAPEPPSFLVHRLVGSAGLHGLDEVADRARELEAALQAHEGEGYRPVVAAALLDPLRGAVRDAVLGRPVRAARGPETLH